jgi:hypothetical protein
MTAAATTKIREPGGAPQRGIYPLHYMAKWVNDDYA